MSIDRKALRAKTNRIKWGKQGTRNECGKLDLTPFNAAQVEKMKKIFTREEMEQGYGIRF